MYPELAAAKTVAAKAGLGVVEPKLLKVAKHVTVQLGATPVVARIASADERSAQSLALELEIGRCLASRAAPTARPASIVDPGPYYDSGYAVTLWDFIEGRAVESEADELAGARALRLVHDALEGIHAELPSFTLPIDSVEPILSDPSAAPELGTTDRLFLRDIYASLREKLACLTLDYRPIHGDTHSNNILVTASGAVWMDLESVCKGPLEWDVLTLPARAQSEFPDINPELMRLLTNVRSLCVAAWCWRDFGRSPEISEAATYHLSSMKARFA